MDAGRGSVSCLRAGWLVDQLVEGLLVDRSVGQSFGWLVEGQSVG